MRREYPSAIASDATPREGLIYLAQRLEELSSPSAMDSFRAMSANVPTLISEAIEQTEVVQQGIRGVPPSVADPVIDELASRVPGNAILRAVVGDRDLIPKIRASDTNDRLQVLRQLKEELSGWAYATQAMRALQDGLNDSDKSRTDFLASELVTTLINLGMSRRHIHERVIGFFWADTADVTSSNDLRRFLLGVFPHGHSFTLLFGVSSEIDLLAADEFSTLGVTVVNTTPDKFISIKTEIQNEMLGYDKYLVVSGITALDKHSAILVARKRVSLLRNLYRMFNHDKVFYFSETVAVEQCCEDDKRLVRPEGYVRHVLNDRSERFASSQLTSLLNSSQFLRGRHYDKFVSVSEFHGLGLDSTSLENKLLNLWISLETICPSVKGHSKIDSVIGGAIPALGLQYVDRIVSALLNDLNSWDKQKFHRHLRCVGDEILTAKERFLLFLVHSRFEGALSQLFSDLGDNVLLRSRLFTTRARVRSSGGLKEMLSGHLIRVEWQLRRIYRARNSIVHLGRSPQFLAALIDSAHDYFDQVLGLAGEISRGPNGFRNFDTAFSFISWEFDEYKKRVDTTDVEDDASLRQLLWRKKRAVSRFEVIQAGPKGL